MTPTDKPSSPPASDLRDLERLIEFEVKQRDDRERAQGWTPWLLVVAICALLWRLVESTGQQDWPTVGLFWATSILLIDMIRSLRTWLTIESVAEEPAPRFFALNWLLHGSREHLVLVGTKLFGAAFLVYFLADLSPPVRWFWLVYLIISALEVPVVLILSYSSHGIKVLNPGASPALRVGLWLRWLTMIAATLVLAMQWWTCLDLSLTREGLKTALLMIGAAELTTLWSEFHSGTILRDSLLQLRRAIALGELTVEDAKRRLDQILHGASLPQFLAKDVKAFDESLAELISAHGIARNALSAATVENPATVTEARTKVETAQSLLKKVVDARLRLILRTGIIAGQSTHVERELKGLSQRGESAVAEVTKVQAEHAEMLRRFDPPAPPPQYPPII